jgi:hypothetical protein
MCRSIKTLRRKDEITTEEEVRAAALQFVRKVSGFRVPSRVNEEAFHEAVREIAASVQTLLDNLTVRDQPARVNAGVASRN